MNRDDQFYHRDRERQCRSMAELAADPDIRRRHEELAELHAARAALFGSIGEPDATHGLLGLQVLTD